MRGFYALALVGSLLFAGCGGSTPPPKTPDDDATEKESSDDVEQPPIKEASGDKAANADAAEGGDDGSARPKKQDAAEPEFGENLSVDEAINAVPQGTQRLNIEQEALSRPLMDPKVYEPCKMGNAHFKLRVAIWNGKAVGLDVTAMPKNDKLSDCIKTQLRALTWPDKVKSLNTVEYQF